MSNKEKNKYLSVTFPGIKAIMIAVIMFTAFMIMPTITNAAPSCTTTGGAPVNPGDPACYTSKSTTTNWTTQEFVGYRCVWVDTGGRYCKGFWADGTPYQWTSYSGRCNPGETMYWAPEVRNACTGVVTCGNQPGIHEGEGWDPIYKTVHHSNTTTEYTCYYLKVAEWSICDPVTGWSYATKVTQHSVSGYNCDNLNEEIRKPCTPTTQKCNGTCKANSECTGLEQCISGNCRNPDCPSETDCKCPPPPTCPTGSEYGNGYIFDYVDTKWSDWGDRTFCMEGDVVNPTNPTFPSPGGASELWGCDSSAKECQAYRWPKDVKCPFLHNPTAYDYDVTRGDKIIDFYKPVIPKKRAGLLSSGGPERAEFAQKFNLPAGEYEVYLSAYDSYNTRVLATQDHEEFYITLENSTGDKLAETSSTKDLKDKVKTAWWNGPNGYTSGVNGGVSDSNLEVYNGVTTAVARHTVYPADGSNSIVPVCAWFKKVGDGNGGTPPSTVNCGGTCTKDVDCKGVNTCIGGSCKNSDCSGETSCKCSCNQSCADNGICKDIHTCEGDKCINSACPNENDCECSGVEGSVKAPEDCGDNCEEGKLIEARP